MKVIPTDKVSLSKGSNNEDPLNSLEHDMTALDIYMAAYEQLNQIYKPDIFNNNFSLEKCSRIVKEIIKSPEIDRALKFILNNLELIDQLCCPVRWHQSMGVLRDLGVTTFVEMGHGEVLSGNLKRSWIGATIVAVSISAAIGGYLLRRKSKKTHHA